MCQRSGEFPEGGATGAHIISSLLSRPSKVSQGHSTWVVVGESTRNMVNTPSAGGDDTTLLLLCFFKEETDVTFACWHTEGQHPMREHIVDFPEAQV